MNKIDWSNKDQVLEAVRSDEKALMFASEELRGDEEFILEILKSCGEEVMIYANKELRSNREFMLEAVKVNANVFEFATKELRGDREVILEAVKGNGILLREHFSFPLKEGLQMKNSKAIKKWC